MRTRTMVPIEPRVIVPKRDRSTFTALEVADLLGVSDDTVYAAIRQTGEVAGVKAIRVAGRVVIPKAPLLRALGLEAQP